MKKEKRSMSNTALCAMAASVLGLFAASAFLTAVAAKKHCTNNISCSADQD